MDIYIDLNKTNLIEIADTGRASLFQLENMDVSFWLPNQYISCHDTDPRKMKFWFPEDFKLTLFRKEGDFTKVISPVLLKAYFKVENRYEKLLHAVHYKDIETITKLTQNGFFDLSANDNNIIEKAISQSNDTIFSLLMDHVKAYDFKYSRTNQRMLNLIVIYSNFSEKRAV
jgi:hypothetical protein